VIAEVLQRHGIDISTTAGASLRTKDDPAHLMFCLEQGRVLVTHDPDFLRWAAAGHRHASMAYCAMRSRTPGQIIRSLILIQEVLTPEEMAGRVEFL
jgi:predicted nuclease of predicted toxin-antitoxin system